MKLFLSILYQTEMENLTYDIANIIYTLLSSLNFSSEGDSSIIVFLYGHLYLQNVVF